MAELGSKFKKSSSRLHVFFFFRGDKEGYLLYITKRHTSSRKYNHENICVRH